MKTIMFLVAAIAALSLSSCAPYLIRQPDGSRYYVPSVSATQSCCCKKPVNWIKVRAAQLAAQKK